MITTLLPREKTYNVASISENNISLGGGIATQVLGVSGSWFRGHKTYYVVQDQDTVAKTFVPGDSRKWDLPGNSDQSWVVATLEVA